MLGARKTLQSGDGNCKPKDLIGIPCMLAGCPDSGVVLDMFAGSGTVGVVAEKIVRDYILFDLNPQYIEIARERIGEH